MFASFFEVSQKKNVQEKKKKMLKKKCSTSICVCVTLKMNLSEDAGGRCCVSCGSCHYKRMIADTPRCFLKAAGG